MNGWSSFAWVFAVTGASVGLGAGLCESIRSHLSWSERPPAHRAALRYAFQWSGARGGLPVFHAIVMLTPLIHSIPRPGVFSLFALVALAPAANALLCFELMRRSVRTGRLVELSLAGYTLQELVADHYAAVARRTRFAPIVCGAVSVSWVAMRTDGIDALFQFGFAFLGAFVLGPLAGYSLSIAAQQLALDPLVSYAMTGTLLRPLLKLAIIPLAIAVVVASFGIAGPAQIAFVLADALVLAMFFAIYASRGPETHDLLNPLAQRAILDALAERAGSGGRRGG